MGNSKNKMSNENKVSNADKFGVILMIVGIALGIHQSLYANDKLATFMIGAFFRSICYGFCLNVGGCIFGHIFGDIGMLVLGCVGMSIPIWYYVH